MPGLINGSGHPNDDFLHLPERGFDVSRSNVPVAIAVAISLALTGAAFQIGKLFSRYEIERGEILDRLDRIEGMLGKLTTGSVNKPLRKSREADRG